ncbi:MAG: MFS transporter [Pseudomonadota bacterium]
MARTEAEQTPEWVARANGRVFYGWVIVAVASFGVFSSGPGQSHTFSAFLDPISRDLGIGTTTISIAYGIATLAAAFLLPYMGRRVDRHGPKTMLFVITGALGAACLFFGAAANFLWLAVGFGLLRFFGQGSLMLTCANLVSQWFSRSRGLAMSLMALGFGVSMAVHPPLSHAMIEAFGWRTAWVLLGVLTWLTMLPAIWLFVFNRPEDVGLNPDGDAVTAPAKADADPSGDAANEAPAIVGLTLQEALATPTFYVLSAGWCAIAMLATTLHFYQVKILTTQGLSAETAASIFTVSAVTMVCSMPLVGRAFDTLKTRYVVGAALFVTAGSLTAVTFATDTTSALVYAVIFGLNNALSMTMFGYIWPRYFGRKHLGSIQGTGQLVGVVGASLGPLPVGLAYDTLGDATGTLLVLAAISAVIGVVSIVTLKTPPTVLDNPALE